MNRPQLACYGLLASAFVLAGLLLLSTGRVLPEAQGDLVLARDNLTFLTTQTASDEEALFVLDSVRQRLLIYTIELRGRGGRLQLELSYPVEQLFGGRAPAGAVDRRAR